MVETRRARNGGEVAKTLASDMEDMVATSPQPGFSKEEAQVIRKSLLSWYDSNHRLLPWRENEFSKIASAQQHRPIAEKDKAYAVWVSEMMLQQTRVATVVQYYQRWMQKWPTLVDLSQASQEEVNSVWAGLGYYRRARFLLQGAKLIVDENGGTFPSSVSELQKIPGIGSYTAGAIASIAFKQPVPVVDGNVVRVLCRLRAISANPKTSSSVKVFWALAEQLVDAERPGDLNQALMELGATACSSTSPSCAACPVAAHCKALALVSNGENGKGSVTDFPMKVPKAVPRKEYVAVCVIERSPRKGATEGCADSSFLLVQRPQEGLLAGLWEFPSAPLDKLDGSFKSRMHAMDKHLKQKLGLEIGHVVSAREVIGENTHIFSHIRLHMWVEWLFLEGSTLDLQANGRVGSNLKWVHASKISSSGLTSGVRKVLDMFLAFRQARETPFATLCDTKRRKTSVLSSSSNNKIKT